MKAGIDDIFNNANDLKGEIIMFFSVITVCYNCKSDIERTIQSVLDQSMTDYEYIIIDGASKDGTTEIANKYTECGHHIILISEPDNGIYDAMNKGVKLSSGRYIFFLNAGDLFHSKTILEDVKKIIEKEQKDIYYGDVCKDGFRIRQNKGITMFGMIYLEDMLCHQSIFAKANQCKMHPFNTDFRICADRDWLIQIIKEKASIQYMPNVVVSDYDTTGVSSNISVYQGDSLNVVQKHGGNTAVFFVKMKRFIGRIIGHK